jgi:geranylgeranyl diphosphate synthase type I
MPLTLAQDLECIAHTVRELLADPSQRPAFAPETLRLATLAYPQAGGKALRPALVVWACEALGGRRDLAMRAGAAVELYHTYTLVHDDVIDRDPVRRGQPSVHTRLQAWGCEHWGLADDAEHYGISMAILAGDCLQAWAVDLLASLAEGGAPPAVVLRALRRLEGEIGPTIVEGEARDIELPFQPIPTVTREAIFQVMQTKTAALFGYCAWLGGLLARGEEDAQVAALATCAEHAGIAFQIQDDILGLVGDAAVLGKPVGSDLREGKRTLILASAWPALSAAGQQAVTRVLGNPSASHDEVVAATAVIQDTGAIDRVQTIANTYRDAALATLATLPATDARARLQELVERMVARAK